jgi:hypothetical protein
LPTHAEGESDAVCLRNGQCAAHRDVRDYTILAVELVLRLEHGRNIGVRAHQHVVAHTLGSVLGGELADRGLGGLLRAGLRLDTRGNRQATNIVKRLGVKATAVCAAVLARVRAGRVRPRAAGRARRDTVPRGL